jgi:FdhD protein
MGATTQRRPVIRLRANPEPQENQPTLFRHDRPDVLAVEEPLEIRVDGEQFSVTMRSPGDDFDLVAGFLVSEGMVFEHDHLLAMRYCSGLDADGHQTYNVIDAVIRADVPRPEHATARQVYTTSSCGLCGAASIEAVTRASQHPVRPPRRTVAYALLSRLPDLLREGQAAFDRTGGVHAAGLFTADGELLCLREDVGRHNAVDKVVGWALREGRLPLEDTVLQVSGRASFELVQKASMAGIPMLAAVSAPSSLAVDLAQTSGLTLVGFSRGTGMNVYAHPERISGLPPKR